MHDTSPVEIEELLEKVNALTQSNIEKEKRISDMNQIQEMTARVNRDAALISAHSLQSLLKDQPHVSVPPMESQGSFPAPSTASSMAASLEAETRQLQEQVRTAIAEAENNRLSRGNREETTVMTSPPPKTIFYSKGTPSNTLPFAFLVDSRAESREYSGGAAYDRRGNPRLLGQSQ